MKSGTSTNERRFLIPETVQTSAMDCGPAALKSLLEGFGISVRYGRLREACQTNVDGTSINTLEDIAQTLGVAAQQLMTPTDHLLLPDANLLPALVVTVLPSGLPHFVVIWRTVGNWVQVMDPAVGRRWISQHRLRTELYLHHLPFPATAWRAWAASAGFEQPLRRRLENLDIHKEAIAQLLVESSADCSWYTFAVLDATTRFVALLVRNKGVKRGREAQTLLQQLFAQVRQTPTHWTLIPATFWSVLPAETSQVETSQGEGTHTETQLIVQGAVLLQVLGAQRPDSSATVSSASDQDALTQDTTTDEVQSSLRPQSTALLAEAPIQPEVEIFKLLRQDGLFTPVLLLIATLLAAATITVEATVLRGLLGMATLWVDKSQVGILVALCLFAGLLLLLELPLANLRQRIGRRLEAGLRIALLEKIARLGDHYFRSRLIADMVERAYSLHSFHRLPDLALRFCEVTIQLCLTAAGIIFLYPNGAIWVLLATCFAMAAALLTHPLVAEREMRTRTHSGALSRFYLDALLGLTPIRTHSAERVVRREHESLLAEWVQANLLLQRTQRLIQGAVSLVGMGFAIWIVFSYLKQGYAVSGSLLLIYWTLNLPTLGQSVVSTVQQYPVQRNHLLRLLEPLGATEEEGDPTTGNQALAARPTQEEQAISRQRVSVPQEEENKEAAHTGVAIHFENVTAQASGRMILQQINLAIQAGEHVAIVGPSGAGKSSLAGLLLGWLRPAQGQIWVDGKRLTGSQLIDLRQMTAWVDPAIQIWNRTLAENLYYGVKNQLTVPAIGTALEAAQLYDLLEQLPMGLETQLGESGGLISGGEGQRVRFGRALMRPTVRLTILDEPFRGLDRTKRRQLLTNARRHWQGNTLLCITHDVGETEDFARVLVMEGGRVVEDGSPAELMTSPHSRYRALLSADVMVRQRMWEGAIWRKFWLENGRLSEQGS